MADEIKKLTHLGEGTIDISVKLVVCAATNDLVVVDPTIWNMVSSTST
jgi:hypothetical protein